MKYQRRTMAKGKKKTLSPILDGKSNLGGLTWGSLTGRPHMGPLNKVTKSKLSDADEPYRQHDIGYSKIKNPYFNFNEADQKLINDLEARKDSPDYNMWDSLAKAFFTGKKYMDWFSVPSVKNNKKNVNSYIVENPRDSSQTVEVKTDLSFPKFRDSIQRWYESSINFPSDYRPSMGTGRNHPTGPRDFRPVDSDPIPTSTAVGAGGKNIYSKIKYSKY